MKIKYTNTQEEMYNYNLEKTLKSAEFQEDVRRMKKIYIYMSLMVIAVGIFMIIGGIMAEDAATKTGNISRGASFVIMGLFSMSFGWFYKVIRSFFIKRDLKKKDFGEEEVELDINSKNINWTYRNNKGVIKQTEDIRINENDEAFMMVTRKHTFIIPKRIFTEETMAEFKNAINYDKRSVNTVK